LGNGLFATRGAFEECFGSDLGRDDDSLGTPRCDAPVCSANHYPGTYLAGGYDRLQSRVSGRTVENEDLVNWPNWLPLTFRCEGGDWFVLESTDVLEFEIRLDLRRGLLDRRVLFRDSDGREFSLNSRRLVHMGRPHVAALRWELTPLNWSGTVEIRTALDGNVRNRGVPRYRELRGDHHAVVGTSTEEDGVLCLTARSRQSEILVALAARTQILGSRSSPDVPCPPPCPPQPGRAERILRVPARAGEPVRVEKAVTLYSSRDFALSSPLDAARTWVRRLPDFEHLVKEHERAWDHLWQHLDFDLESPESDVQAVLRLHLFHLLQTASPHTVDRDVGLPARGLHGEAYRGHVFWDELFAFPLFNFRLPELTRSLLLYRYRRLDEARWAARQAGYEGAMFPWQSGSDGQEQTQSLMLNPHSGHWIPDDTHRQRHVNAAIAYNVWQYFQVTEDRAFLSSHGAELLLEIARFWGSIARYDEERRRYVIQGVVGPDEFHTRYPGRDTPGLDNNAYTNVMASWSLATALQALSSLAEERRTELLSDLALGPRDLERWDRISKNLYIPFQEDGIISQFEGWERLEAFDWDSWKREGSERRLDRLLEAVGDDVNRYQATKQADVLMLFFLFSSAELQRLFQRLGYEWNEALLVRNAHYYLARTSHGSTLSKIVHAWVTARLDRKHSWDLFREALRSDIDDVQGGTTPEGIHIGAMAGTVDLVQRCYTGLEVREGVLWLNPRLPEELSGLRLTVRYREHWLSLECSRSSVTVKVERGPARPVRVGLREEVVTLCSGEARTFQRD
jgi:trehalose/maltose hydrolase-like predicted phosphorylase